MADPKTPDALSLPETAVSWAEKVGAVIGGITMAFLMALLLFSALGYDYNPSLSFIVLLIFALGCGLSASFIGGGAVARGRITVPILKTPVKFAVTGGVAVILLVLIIGKYLFLSEEKKETPVAFLSHAFHENPFRRGEAVFIKPPKISLVAEHKSIASNSVSAFIAKNEDISLRNFLPLVKGVNAFLQNPSQLNVVVDPTSFISEKYHDKPHGIYNTRVRVGTGTIASEKPFEFNYVFFARFTNIHTILKVLEPPSAFSLSSQGNAIAITHDFKKRGVVSGKLRQQFDFGENFYVKGSFSMLGTLLDPPGFDLGFCDGPGDKVAVIFGDGGIDRYSIRHSSEDNSAAREFRSPPHAYSLRMGTNVLNFFEIRVTTVRNVEHWQMFVSNASESARTNLIHERFFPLGTLATAETELRFKVWNRGMVVIHEIEVGKLIRIPERRSTTIIAHLKE